MPGNDIVVTCPNCRQAFALTDAVGHQMRDQYADELEHELRQRIEQEFAGELQDMSAQIQEGDQKLEQMREQEVALRKERRRLEEQRKEQDLALERARDEIGEQARAEARNDYEARLRALGEQLRLANERSAQLERQTQQGRPQEVGVQHQILFGEELRRRFPEDEVATTRRGQHGADILQTVRTKGGRACGRILYECKNTTAWDGKWVGKLRDDQRRENAAIGVIVSSQLPDSLESSGDVYVYDFQTVWYVVPALRRMLQQEALIRWAAREKQDRASQIYDYVVTGDFFARLRDSLGIIEEMGAALASEKRTTQQRWAAAEKRIERSANSLVGLVGDLEGLGVELPPGAVTELPPAP
jgi:hypothetical protein